MEKLNKTCRKSLRKLRAALDCGDSNAIEDAQNTLYLRCWEDERDAALAQLTRQQVARYNGHQRIGVCPVPPEELAGDFPVGETLKIGTTGD
jgi:hypothetical protein